MRLRKRTNEHRKTRIMTQETLDNLFNAEKANLKAKEATEGESQKWIKLYLDAIQSASEIGLCSIALQTPCLIHRAEVDKRLRKLGFTTGRHQGSGTITVISWLK